jgi:hypothetical protein
MRHIEVVQPMKRPQLVKPVRVLIVMASPRDLPKLDLAKEKEKIEDKLGMLPRREVVAEFVEHASLEAIEEALRSRYHILHFIGHGGFAGDEGAICIEGDDGCSRLITATVLYSLLQDQTSLQLAVLNSCESARTCRLNSEPFSNLAAALVKAGLPAVVAMQFKITDTAAINFSSTLYRELADGRTLDVAMAECRKAIYIRDPASLEWGAPVCLMRMKDAKLFEGIVRSSERHYETLDALVKELTDIVSTFDSEEMRTLCYAFGVDYDLPMEEHAVEVIRIAPSTQQLPRLIDYIKDIRPERKEVLEDMKIELDELVRSEDEHANY